jgi:enoyl-CoA hydratase/carnithine racemase
VGGTTRLPRLVGLQNALPILLTGEPVSASKARRIGLVDEVLPAASFQERVAAYARGVADGVRPPRARRGLLQRVVDDTPPGRALALARPRRACAPRPADTTPPLPHPRGAARGSRQPAASGLRDRGARRAELITATSRRTSSTSSTCGSAPRRTWSPACAGDPSARSRCSARASWAAASRSCSRTRAFACA